MSRRERAFIRHWTRVATPPLVPEIRLHLAEELMPLWQTLARDASDPELPPPYWAFAWAGGQALARYVLDTPDLVAGRRVADIGSGGGIVAIAAARVGAAQVDAIDIEPYAIEAIRLNAAANGVADRVDPIERDPVGSDAGWEVVLAGDVWYEADLAAYMEPWLRTLAARGALVLTGDLGRAYLPAAGLTELARCVVPTVVDLEDVPEKTARVLRVGPTVHL